MSEMTAREGAVSLLHHICPSQGILFRYTSCIHSLRQVLCSWSHGSLPYLLHELIPVLCATHIPQLLCCDMNNSYHCGLHFLFGCNEVSNHGLADMDRTVVHQSQVTQPHQL